MSSRTLGLAALFAATMSLFAVTTAQGAKKTEHTPRPISGAEAAAVEMVADFLSRGPVAFQERLAPESPLAAMAAPDALAEIEARTGPAKGASWSLQTVVPSLADHAAVFGVDFESGIDDVIELNLVEHGGRYQLVMLRSLAEPSPYAIRTEWMAPDEAPEAPVEESKSRLPYFPFIGGIIAVLSIISLAILRAHPLWGRLMLVATVGACAGALYLVQIEVRAAAERSGAASVAASEAASGFDRLGALAEARRALASGSAMELGKGLTTKAADVAAIWQAQVELRDQKLEEAGKTLERFSISTDRPMVALLRARLAASNYDDVTSSLAYERAMRLGPGRDQLWFETAQWLYALGFEERALGYLNRLPEMGSRDAEVYYALASFAGAKSKKPEAVAFLRTAWNLEPVPRSEIVATPALTAVMRLETAKAMVPLASPIEPRFRTEPNRTMQIALPAGADAIVTGGALRIAFGDDRMLFASGGASLVGPTALISDAVSNRRRDESRALADLDDLLSFRGSPSALAHPAVRERFMRTATALAERGRWEDVDHLTSSLSASAESVPPDLLFLRGTALRKLHREGEAKRLLAELVVSPTMERRSDPRILYQLGEMLAAMELYTPAIRTLERVDSMMDELSLDDRIRQLSMNQRLAERYSEYTSDNFVFHYPDNLDTDNVAKIAEVMEAELTRLRKIIPLAEFRKTTINVLWWNEFRATYTGSDHILGFYDGKITLPLAGISSLAPPVVSLMTHELAHAVIAQATNDRAPAWVQEGLAQRVEMVPYHANAFNMYEADRLLPIALINPVLSDSVDVDMIGQAYITSQTVIRFIESKYGAKSIPTLLEMLRDGESSEAALAHLTGKPLDAIEAEFREWGQSDNRVFENKDIIRYDTNGSYKPMVRFSKRKSGKR